jgi:hypothetical protein
MSVQVLEPRAFQVRDSKILEMCLPAHMLILAIEECQKTGFTIRADVLHHLSVASVKPLASLDMFNVARLAARVEGTAVSMMRDLAAGEPRHALYVCAMFPLLLVDEGLLDDKTCQAVLVALLLMEDAKNDDPDVDGLRPVWSVNERLWRKEAGYLITRAQLQGLYTRSVH